MDTRGTALGELSPDGRVEIAPERRDERGSRDVERSGPRRSGLGNMANRDPSGQQARGTLTRKMVRQLTASMSHPPRKAPTALVAPANPDQSP